VGTHWSREAVGVAGSIARFGEFEFDFDEMVLRQAGKPVPLQPQPTQVLAILLERPGRLVSRDELKSRVWENRIVEFDAGLNFSINQVRRALADSAADPKYVETVPRRGYRCIAAVVRSAPDQRLSSLRSTPRRWLWVVAAMIGLGASISIALRAPSPARDEDLKALSPTLQSTYREARWLYEHGDAQRALTRLDSVRLAAPDFVQAWAMTSHARRVGHDLVGARAAAERAIELDPGLADAHYALGLTAFLETRGREALDAFAEASRLDPQRVEYRQWLAEALANQLRLDEAIEQLEAARRIDPISNLVGVDLATVYIAADRLDAAVTYCEESLELVETAERWARDCLLTAHHFRGDDALATDQARALMELTGATPEEVSTVRTLRDYFGWDLARLDRLESAGESVGLFERVKATARLEDRDGTLRGLRTLRQARHFSIQWAPRDVWFRFLHRDPEFQAILREADLPVPGAPGP
jgi:DNA-binding winged helix-turn-helix (wHTH) protein/tetratricopeptide (TPR) repeat protein